MDLDETSEAPTIHNHNSAIRGNPAQAYHRRSLQLNPAFPEARRHTGEVRQEQVQMRCQSRLNRQHPHCLVDLQAPPGHRAVTAVAAAALLARPEGARARAAGEGEWGGRRREWNEAPAAVPAWQEDR